MHVAMVFTSLFNGKFQPATLSPTPILVLSGILGHISFNRLEPRSLPVILSLLLGPPSGLAVYYCSFYSSFLLAILVSFTLYIGSLVFSTVVYRLSPLHPLAQYPGPLICKVTRLWAFYMVKTGKQHYYYKSLHERYGTHVRTGPNHLFIRDSTAIPTILGAKGFPRTPRYAVTNSKGTTGSLLSISDVNEHAQRRRIWDRGLNMSAIKDYQDMLVARIEQLVNALEKKQGDVNLSAWLSYFSFDFMGDLAFGGAYNLMGGDPDADTHIYMAGLAGSFSESLGTIPWAKPIRNFIPGVGYVTRNKEFSMNSVLARKAKGSTRKDIFYYLLDEEGVGSGPGLSLPTLMHESVLAVNAGSDTTGTALSHIFFYLISHPEAFKRLQAEVDHNFPVRSGVCLPSDAGEMPYLNAVINEALRLWPAVPTGLQRLVTPGIGKVMIAGQLVPEGTTVQVSIFSLHRDPRYFSPDPNSFRPERWLSEPGFKHDASAFIPFSYGPMNCAGKALALQELFMVTCTLIRRFEFKFAPTWNPNEWEKNLRDAFVMTKGKMPVLITSRY